MRRITQWLIIALIASIVGLQVPHAGAQQTAVPKSVVIVAEGLGTGVKQGFLPIPVGNTVNVRLEGRDGQGKPVRLDPEKIVWSCNSHDHAFTGKRTTDGSVQITATKDIFDQSDNAEPGGWISAKYDGLFTGVTLSGVLQLKGKWVLKVSGDEINLDIVRQSGRWVVDSETHRGTIDGTTLKLHMWHKIKGLGVKELWPVVTFTSRTAGYGHVTVYVLGIPTTETFSVQRQKPEDDSPP